jgi:short-subunit dehydrogenase
MVTGASSGIGQAYAEALARRGFALVLVARRTRRLEALAARLAERHGVAAEVIAADLSDSDSLEPVVQRASEGLAMLVNNAGFGAFEPFTELDPGVLRRLVGVHVLAPLELTRAAAPAMVAAGSGSIVNVASGLAFSATLPHGARKRKVTIAYAGAKAFVLTFTRALAEEMGGTGVRVQALCPSVVATELHGTALPAGAMRAEDVVDASLEGLRRGETLCMPGLEDDGLVRRLGMLELALLEGNRGPELAARYREGTSP